MATWFLSSALEIHASVGSVVEGLDEPECQQQHEEHEVEAQEVEREAGGGGELDSRHG